MAYWWLQVIIGKAALRKSLIILWVGVMSENKEHFLNWHYYIQSVSSVAQSCLTLCNLMACSTPGLPVHYQLKEFTQTHVHWVSDTIQPPHSLSPLLFLPSIFPPSGSFQISQLFASGSQSIRASASVSVLPMNNQGWFPLRLTGLIFFLSKRFSRIFSTTTVSKHQFCRLCCFQCIFINTYHRLIFEFSTVLYMKRV